MFTSRQWETEELRRIRKETPWQQIFKNYIGPALGNKDAADVISEDILALLSPL